MLLFGVSHFQVILGASDFDFRVKGVGFSCCSLLCVVKNAGYPPCNPEGPYTLLLWN